MTVILPSPDCSEHSSGLTLSCGVQQGSVLGPLLFAIYTSPVATLLREHGVHFHLCADDTQIFLEFCVSDTLSVHEIVSRLEACVAAVQRLIRANVLQLNAEKTEFLIILNETVGPFSSPVRVGEAVIEPSGVRPQPGRHV